MQPNILVMHGEQDDVLPIDFYNKTKEQLDHHGMSTKQNPIPTWT